ncbi:MAG: hypothetical protein U0575_12310 [Phycisphaerales bacterium]
MRAVAAILVLVGLAASSCGTGSESASSSDAVPARPPTPSAGALSSLMAADNGLEVRKWVVQDDAPRIAEALRHYGAPVDDPALEADLARNGFTLVRVDQADVEALLQEIGPALSDMRSWHGQAPRWRELVRHGARDSIAAVVDGRVRVFSDGAVSFVARAWTLPMEDGAIMQLEMRSEFEMVARGYRDLVRAEVPRGETLPPGTIELEVGVGEAWVMTCITPRDTMPPTDEATKATDSRGTGSKGTHSTGTGAKGSASKETGSKAPAARSGDSKAPSARGPVPDDAVFGPDTQLPQTLGQMLFASDVPATRTLLVFVAKLPSASATLAPHGLAPPPSDAPGDAPAGPTADPPGGAPDDAPPLEDDPERLPPGEH